MNTDEVRRALEERAVALGLRHEALARHVRHEDDRERDDAEAATWRAADEVWAHLDEATVQARDAVVGALRRIADGTYGICVRCGATIEAGRLSSMPEAALCVTCAREVESGR